MPFGVGGATMFQLFEFTVGDSGALAGGWVL